MGREGVRKGRQLERSRQEKEARGGWVRRTQFGVVVVESINRLLIVVSERRAETGVLMRACLYVCVCACVRAYMCVCMIYIKHGYCLIDSNGRLQYLRCCWLKCMLMWFLS